MKFSGGQLKLTVSATNEYQSGGNSYHGDITLKLCVNNGNDCSPNFKLTYNNCNADTLSIDTTKFASPAATYDIRSPEVTFSWNGSSVSSSNSLKSLC